MEVQLFHLIVFKITLCQHLRDLTSSVSPEVKTDDKIAFLNTAYRAAYFIDLYNWPDKFIRHPVFIGFSYGRKNVHGFFTLPVYQRVVGQFYPFPTLVTVHGVIPSYYRCYFPAVRSTVVLNLLKV